MNSAPIPGSLDKGRGCKRTSEPDLQQERQHLSGSSPGLRPPTRQSGQPALRRRPGKALSHLFTPCPALPLFSSLCVQLSADDSRLLSLRSSRFRKQSLRPGQGGRTRGLMRLRGLPEPTLRLRSSFPAGPGNPHACCIPSKVFCRPSGPDFRLPRGALSLISLSLPSGAIQAALSSWNSGEKRGPESDQRVQELNPATH